MPRQPLNNDEPMPSGPFTGKRVIISGQDEVEQLQLEIEQILDVLGHPEALVTDRSSICDFPLNEPCALLGVDPDAPSFAKLSERLGTDVHHADLLVDIAW